MLPAERPTVHQETGHRNGLDISIYLNGMPRPEFFSVGSLWRQLLTRYRLKEAQTPCHVWSWRE